MIISNIFKFFSSFWKVGDFSKAFFDRALIKYSNITFLFFQLLWLYSNLKGILCPEYRESRLKLYSSSFFLINCISSFSDIMLTLSFKIGIVKFKSISY